MRVFFSGSGRHAAEATRHSLPEDLRQAARQLGHGVALAGHRLLVNTEKASAVDPFVVEGAQRLGALAVRPVVEVHRMEGRPAAFNSASGVRLVRVTYDHPPYPEEKSLGARGGAVASADAVVVLGGSDSTRAVVQWADTLAKPVVPVAAFGGAGEAALRARESLWRSMPGGAETWAQLAGNWRGEDSVRAVLALLERLAGQHAYHLSCAAADAVAGDHLEALLGRLERKVHRIEGPVGLGDAQLLGERLAAADTLVVVWSRSGATDARCLLEREAASRTMGMPGARLHRVAVLRVDDTLLPAFAGEVFDGATRLERETAALRLVAAEARHEG